MNESQTKKKICVRYSYFDETRYALAFLMKINMSIIPSYHLMRFVWIQNQNQNFYKIKLFVF